MACELEGKSRRQAAAQLGVPEGTLSTHLARGRKLLRERLLRRGVSLGVGPFAGLAQPIPLINVPERLAGSTVRAALGYTSGGMAAGKVPATVASLAEGVLKMMLVTRLVVLIASMVAVGLTAVVTGAAVFNGPDRAPGARPRSRRSATSRNDPADQAKAVPRRARVQGIVVDEAGKPVAGIEVRVNNAVDRQSRGRHRRERPVRFSDPKSQLRRHVPPGRQRGPHAAGDLSISLPGCRRTKRSSLSGSF